MNSEISELQEQGKQFVSLIRQAQRQFFSIPRQFGTLQQVETQGSGNYMRQL